MSPAKQVRSVEVAFATAYLDSVGIDDLLEDFELAEIVDEFLLGEGESLAAFVADWKDRQYPREGAHE